VVEDVSTLGSMGAALRQLAAAPPEILVRGTVIDEQYEIERVLGSGAMGVVYLASDRRLERNVAIKLVKDRSATALSRASREAMALARLSHPNVVAIHQIGELDGRVYVAMEYVAGSNGREWAEQRRDVAEVVSVYLAVGDGLAAAHAAGLVHRDFKPDNVLVGDDGRARVADFGLARSEPAALAVGSVEEQQRSQIAGTPAYMAPEQYRGEAVDARADQFAYCTSLWEALHGKRPFAADSGDTISNAKAVLVRGEPERARRIPRHIDVALRRGLSAQRADRWPSMAPLLAELRRDPRRKWRALIAVPIIALVAFFALRGSSATDACDGGATRIAEQWGAPQIAQLESFAPSGAPLWDVSSVRAAISANNTWAEHWAQSYRNVCRAGWSAQLHDRGMLCLARAEHGLAGTLEALDNKVSATKLDAIFANVPRPEPCADPSYLEADVPPPANPAVAAAVTNVQAELQRVDTLLLESEVDRADEVLHQIESRADLDYAPLRAEIHLARAQILFTREDPKALDRLVDAYFEARDAGARAWATKAAEHVSALHLEVSHEVEAAEWARLAMTESASVNDSLVKMRATLSHASVLIAQNKADQAVEELSALLVVLRADGQGDRSGDVFYTRADAYDKLAKYELALADANEGLRLFTRINQADGSAANMEAERSLILIHMNRSADAVAAARHGLAMAEKFDSPGGIVIGTMQGALGAALTSAGQFDEALTLLDASLAADVHKGGSYNIASDYNNRCDLLQRMNRLAEAIEDCKRAAAMWVDSVGADSREEGLTQGNLASALLEQSPTEAIAADNLAIKLLGAHPDDPLVFTLLLNRANANRMLGHTAEAGRDLDAAEKFATRGAPEWPYDLAYSRAELEFREGHLEPARALATTSHDGYAKLGDTKHADRATSALARFHR
jgi:serine/threonine protein kinase/tetratricopeptide (TPR) repeat protein